MVHGLRAIEPGMSPMGTGGHVVQGKRGEDAVLECCGATEREGTILPPLA